MAVEKIPRRFRRKRSAKLMRNTGPHSGRREFRKTKRNNWAWDMMENGGEHGPVRQIYRREDDGKK